MTNYEGSAAGRRKAEKKALKKAEKRHKAGKFAGYHFDENDYPSVGKRFKGRRKKK